MDSQKWLVRADLKKQVDDIAQDVKNYDPLKSTRTEVEAIGRDLNTNLSADLNKDAGKDTANELEGPGAISPVEARPLPQIAGEPEHAAAEPQRQADDHTAVATTAPVAPETAKEKAPSDSAGRAE